MTITKDSNAPLVVVIGSTGTQGLSVINALAESDKSYRIRGLTRDTSKYAAKALEERDVETFKVSLNADNLTGAKEAFQGANVLFVSFSHLFSY